MKRTLTIFYCFICFVGIAKEPLQLWYDEPAVVWEEMLPLGNGRLGMMPDGGIANERIVLNEITLWSGSPQDPNNYEAYRSLEDIQQLLLQGQNAEAEALVNANFICSGVGSGHGHGANLPYGCFQNLGEMHIQYHHQHEDITGYRRQLDLPTAMAKTVYKAGGTMYRREYFTSFGNDVGIIRLSTQGEETLNFSVTLTREENAQANVSGEELQLFGALNDGYGGRGMQYMARVRILHQGGRLVTEGNRLRVIGAEEAVIYFSAATNFRNNPYEQVSATLMTQALQVPYSDQRKAHISTFQRLFNRVSLELT